MKIIIIDDERPSRSELKYLIMLYREEAEIVESNSGAEAMKSVVTQSFDLAFVDMNLGDMEGIVLAEMMKRSHPDMEIVFATAYNNYAEQAFAIDVLHYILKPFTKEKVEQALIKYDKKKANSIKLALVSKLPIPYDKKTILVDIDDIAYIETYQRRCMIHTVHKSYIGTGSLNSYEQKLKGVSFFRIHKSYLINLNYVIEMYAWFQNTTCVKIKGYEDKIIPVSRSKLKDLKHLFYM